jgi:hypothetical protein
MSLLIAAVLMQLSCVCSSPCAIGVFSLSCFFLLLLLSLLLFVLGTFTGYHMFYISYVSSRMYAVTRCSLQELSPAVTDTQNHTQTHTHTLNEESTTSLLSGRRTGFRGWSRANASVESVLGLGGEELSRCLLTAACLSLSVFYFRVLALINHWAAACLTSTASGTRGTTEKKALIVASLSLSLCTTIIIIRFFVLSRFLSHTLFHVAVADCCKPRRKEK